MFDPLGFGEDIRRFIPDSISQTHMPLLFKDVPEEIKQHARTLLAQGWKFYTVKQSRGRCYGGWRKVITIPTWVIDRQDLSYRIWYICHEMAHAYDNCKHNHGPEFMEWLKKLCPEEHIIHELGYKPRNAKAAGIFNI